MSGIEILVMEGGQLVGHAIRATPNPVVAKPEEPVETRVATLWPWSGSSLWNTSIGSGISVGSTSHALSVELRSVVGQLNYVNYSTPINIAKSGDASLTMREVASGTWAPSVKDTLIPRAPATIHLSGEMAASTVTYNNDNSITFTHPQGLNPDGFMAIVDEVTLLVHEMYKATWDKGGSSTRRLIGRSGTYRALDLKGDGWTDGGARASKLSFTAGLIRKWELDKAATDPRNAIRHALSMAINNNQLLDPDVDTYTTPGYQWPARGFDSNARTAYTGEIRMGMQFVLNPTFDIEASALTNEGKALAYALQDFGAYISDRSTYVSLYVEETSTLNTAAASRMKEDWQNILLAQMVPVLNNNATDVGGPGTRVRPPAPVFA